MWENPKLDGSRNMKQEQHIKASHRFSPEFESYDWIPQQKSLKWKVYIIKGFSRNKVQPPIPYESLYPF